MAQNSNQLFVSPYLGDEFFSVFIINLPLMKPSDWLPKIMKPSDWLLKVIRLKVKQVKENVRAGVFLWR